MAERWLSVKEFRPTVSGIGKVAVHPKGGSMFSYYDSRKKSWSVPCADEAAALNLKATPFKWPKGVIGFYTSPSPSESIIMSKILPSTAAIRTAFGVGARRTPTVIPFATESKSAPKKRVKQDPDAYVKLASAIISGGSKKGEAVKVVTLKKPVKPVGRVQFPTWTDDNHAAFVAAILAAATEAGKGGDISGLAKENGGQLCKLAVLSSVLEWMISETMVVITEDLGDVETGSAVTATVLKAGRAFLKANPVNSGDDVEADIDQPKPAKKRASPIGQDDEDIVMKPARKMAKAPVHGHDNVAGTKKPRLVKTAVKRTATGNWPEKAGTYEARIFNPAGERDIRDVLWDGEQFTELNGKVLKKNLEVRAWRGYTPESLKALAVWTKKHGQ